MKVVKLSIATLALVASSACGSNDDSADPITTSDPVPPTTVRSQTTTVQTTTVETEVPASDPPPTDAPSSTAPPATEAPTTTIPATATSTSTTAPTTPPPTTEPGPTTTLLPAVIIEAIDVDSGTLFGFDLFERQTSDTVVDDISDVIGAPSSDTGFVATPAEQQCSGSERFRSVRWGDLRATFIEDGDGPPESTQTLVAWAVGSENAEQLAPRDERPANVLPSGIVTRDGLGVGSTRSELRALFEDRALDSIDGDRVSIRSGQGAGAISFTFEGDTIVGIGAGPLDCVAPDDEPR